MLISDFKVTDANDHGKKLLRKPAVSLSGIVHYQQMLGRFLVKFSKNGFEIYIRISRKVSGRITGQKVVRNEIPIYVISNLLLNSTPTQKATRLVWAGSNSVSIRWTQLSIGSVRRGGQETAAKQNKGKRNGLTIPKIIQFYNISCLKRGSGCYAVDSFLNLLSDCVSYKIFSFSEWRNVRMEEVIQAIKLQ